MVLLVEVQWRLLPMQVKLLAPVPMPPAIYGIGLNYREHAVPPLITMHD